MKIVIKHPYLIYLFLKIVWNKNFILKLMIRIKNKIFFNSLK